jgi:transcriptional regulator with XRE-family HTH domain
MAVRDNIRKVISEQGYRSVLDFAKKSGLNYVYVNSILNKDRRYNEDTIEAIAKALRVPLYSLFADEPLVPKRVAEREPVIAQIFQDQDTAKEFNKVEGRDDFVPVRIVDTVSLGQGHIISNEETKGYALIYKYALNHKAWTQKRNAEKIICVWASGDSMSPAIQDKSLVAIDVEDRADIRNLKIYAVELPDEGVVLKRLHRTDDHLILFADNPTTPGYPKCMKLNDEFSPIRGRVVWTWNVLE